ncbi:hypothetical protein [Frankia tisae]|uniref:hypothetical protein n=1 Tax=Frankia tisae TaxID=2950104 RepID=UPI0021C1F2AB|nr:hypothetical protein [Frankia tisae]
MIIKADIVGYEVDYWPAGVPFESDDVVRNYYHWEDPYWASRDNIRRVTARFFSGSPIYYLMHWNAGTQLAGLDARAADGSVREEDFAGAVLVEPMDYTCPFCDARLRAAIVDPGSPILGKDRPARLRAHTFIPDCPVCHRETRARVAEFLPPV